MIVAGPNARKDFHYNETEELFYQLEGSIKVIVQEDGQRKEIELHPGDTIRPILQFVPTLR
jgi:3-hydroxyanthranilate 3,4-dioxygenase